MSDGKIEYDVRANQNHLDQDLNEVSQKTEKHASKWKGVLDGFTKQIGASLAGAAMSAAKSAWELGAGFEAGLAKVSTLADTSKVSMDTIGKGLLDISSRYGLAADTMTEAAYNAISSNSALATDSEGLMKVLEASAKLAAAGFTDIDTASSATLKTLNAYGLGVEDTDRIQKILIQTQNNGITTVGELGSVLSNVTPTAAAAGISFEEIGAALATMTASGTPAAQATTQLNAAISSFLKPNETMAAGLRIVAEEMINAGDLTGETAEQFASLTKRAEEITLELSTMDTSTKEGAARYKELDKELTGVNKSINAVTKELSLQILETNGLQGTLTILNDAFDGSTNKMAEALGSSEALKATLQLTGDNADKFTANLQAMSTETDVVGESFDKVSGTSAAQLQRAMTTLQNVLIQLFQAFAPIITVVMDIITVMVQAIASALGPFVQAIQPMIDIVRLLGQVFGDVFGFVIKTALDTFVSLVNSVVQTVQGVFSGLIDFIAGVFTGNWERAWQGVQGIFSGIVNGLSGIFKAPLNAIIDNLNSFLGGLGRLKIPDWVPGAGGKTLSFPKIPRLRVGLDYVPEDNQLAYLHRGEAVLTAAEAKVWREGGSKSGVGQQQFTIDYERLAECMARIVITMDGTAVARLLTPKISNNQARSYESIQRSGFNGQL